MKQNIALILVDLQNDFMPGGSLAVANGDQVVEVANRLINSKAYGVVVATQDWHPANHKSFASNHPGKNLFELTDLNGIPQVLWPDHCVQGTKGAELHAELSKDIDVTFPKGTNPEVDSYSGFLDNDRSTETGLAAYLREKGIEEVHVLGLATDYCVKATALDAIQFGFKTTVIKEGCRAVNMSPDDEERALQEVVTAGGEVLTQPEVTI